jgi:hypothetical protein
MNAIKPLVQKELQQNYIIYGLSALFLVVIWGITILQPGLVQDKWAQILAICIPVALAGAYGLQAFDLEENYHTRDFLLTRPLTVSNIIWTKYFCGLIILLTFTIAWLMALLPMAVKLPVFSDFQSFWGSSFLALVVLVYSASFSTGVFIKGPKKLLLAIIMNLLVLPWFFFCWLAFLSLFYFYPGMMDYQFWAYVAVSIVTLGLIICIIYFLQTVIQLFLQNILFEKWTKPLGIHLMIIILLPLLGWFINTVSLPTVRPFQSLWSSLFSAEEWFIASQSAQQPRGDLYALVDYRGRLGLAHKNEKPKVIYQGERTENQLSGLVWSPDGKKIAFCENNQIKVLTIANQQLLPIIKGETSFWSADSNQMMIIAKTNKTDSQSIRQEFQIFLVDYLRGTVSDFGRLTAPGIPLAWDSIHQNIMYIDDHWHLFLINMNNHKVQVLDLPVSQLREKILFREIIPPPLGRQNFRLAVFGISPKLKKPLPYNVYLYDFNSKLNQVIYVSELKGLSYRDLVIAPIANEALVDLGNGVYRTVKISAMEGR